MYICKTKSEIMKLELKHLAPYLPYGILVKIIENPCKDEIHKLTGIPYDGLVHLGNGGMFGFTRRDYNQIKPILRPLSDLTKEIKLFGSGQEISIVNYLNIANSKTWKWKPRLKTLVLEDYGRGSVSYNMLSSGYLYLPHKIVNVLFENHLDVFGLIDAGLALDINTIPHN